MKCLKIVSAAWGEDVEVVITDSKGTRTVVVKGRGGDYCPPRSS